MTGSRDDDSSPVGAELERQLRDAFARSLAARPEPTSADDDVSPETLHDALTGKLPERERGSALDRAMRTERGRRELALLRVALGAADAAWPDAARGARPRHAAWWLRPSIAAAAAIVLAVGLGGGMWWRMFHASPEAPVGADVTRAARSGVAGVALVVPNVTVAANVPAMLAWRAVTGAARYDVEVMRGDGVVVWSTTTRDTTFALPAIAEPPAAASYDWWVLAHLIGGETRRSPLGHLRRR